MKREVSASVAQAKERRGEPATVHEMPKKRTAKKTAAKKTTRDEGGRQEDNGEEGRSQEAAQCVVRVVFGLPRRHGRTGRTEGRATGSR
ncbi:hypothetical protein OG393_34995 (plasmid) [Streptomyces sp. NBC_01216]|uniref:hypothetical protein n=1 Tax=Streptomyces sp. NBC_01216 TaxID=2903778 RepID=UPI002E15CACD|nr:hypothetical protein OG393_34995 [Streptomyces sp. NBC_01216]